MRGLVELLRGISRLEAVAAGLTAVVMTVLVALEPDILGTPFASRRSVALVGVGTVAAAIALVVMLRVRVAAPVRLAVLGVPFIAVSWWLISPFFLDDVVEDDFVASIVTSPDTSSPEAVEEKRPSDTTPAPEAVLLGSGSFVGLAGHDGSGDAGVFRLAEGSRALRLENFDIDNGPDLRLYLIPGREQRSPNDDSLYLGELRGNKGNQTYALPANFDLAPGDWTVLVWCEAFSVEFVGATVPIRT